MKLPVIVSEKKMISEKDESLHVELELEIPESVIYFDGHFPGYPILPGVAQIHWAEAIGRQYFSEMGLFTRLENVKFQSMIFPNKQVFLNLNYQATKQKLYFSFQSNEQKYSSGRIVMAG